ncbi:GNAT family N-acetyltransferase [Erwinia mallotivora]|uniref:GNAT family N-acetyltransferase n=1 Tax=Erwinia mallotivora TaxID=69222 RepID=UPI0021BECABA|nr:GNAT family N-acetyltransferase [Erwinia mallotivora]
MTFAEGRIRQATASDTDALYEICLKTADAGKDASELYSDPHYPGLRFAVPYARFAPDFAFVLEKEQKVVGYVVAAPDTVAFERRLAQAWWPQQAERLSERQPVAALDSKILDSVRHPETAAEALTTPFPAHLHINLLPEAQRGGWGRRLVVQQLAALKAAGVKGVYVGISLQNEPVTAFYQRLGFHFLFRSNAIYMGQDLN